MTIKDLLTIANNSYPEQGIAQNVDLETGQPLAETGDTLALFVAHEIVSTFDPAATEEEQLATAHNAIRRAAKELDDVADAFERFP